MPLLIPPDRFVIGKGGTARFDSYQNFIISFVQFKFISGDDIARLNLFPNDGTVDGFGFACSVSDDCRPVQSLLFLGCCV